MRSSTIAILIVLATSGTAAEPPLTLHVSPEGKDGWSGVLPEPDAARTDGPLASLEGARDRIRRLRRDAGGKLGPVTVLVKGGAYRMDKPFVLEPEDSGSPGAPVVYAAREKERPVFSGGRTLTGLRQEGALWKCDLPDVREGKWYFRQLFVNGGRRRVARSPNEGYHRIAGLLPGPRDAQGKEIARDRFRFHPGDIRPWPRLEDAHVVLMHSWETSIHPIREVNAAENVVQFTAPLKEWWCIGYWEAAQRYYVENVLELLDQPGEWYLDRKAGVLTYDPMPGEKLGETDVVAPVLEELVRIAGRADEGRLVENVGLRGLSFHHSDWRLAPEGNSSTQAAVEVPAAVTVDGAKGCFIDGCEVAHVGTYGVWFRRGCKECRIERSRLFDLGAGGLRIGEAVMAKTDAAESSGNVADSNHIFDGGHVYAAGVGVWVAQSSHNRISHSDVHDFLYSGFSIGWNWNDAPNRCHHNIIEFNHVHHLVKGVLSDAGAIYCLGVSPGSVIRNNHFHDVWPYDTPPFGWGIYLDATCGGYLVEDNVVHDTLSGGLMYNNGGHEHVIRNNIFALSANHGIWPSFEKCVNAFQHNIVYLTQGELFISLGERSFQQRLAAKEPLGIWDENLYWHSGAPGGLRFFQRTFEEWRSLGLDGRSLIEDPRFVDAEARDFRLRSDSPALRIGCKPIDTSEVGLRGDSSWVEEARKIQYPRTILPPPPAPPAPREVDDGFEGTEPGSLPGGASVSGEEKGASIRVTEEKAATGKRCLQVRDSRALEPSWQPHFYYEPLLREGKVRESFDVWLEPGSRFFTEWRDETGYPDNIGPSVSFDGEGNVLAGGKTLARIPVREWVHVELEAALGKEAPRQFRLTLAPRGAGPQLFEGLSFSGKSFRETLWLGFSSTAASDASFFLDNVQVKRLGP